MKKNVQEMKKNKSSKITALTPRSNENPIKVPKKTNQRINNLTMMIKTDDSKVLYTEKTLMTSRNNFQSPLKESNMSTKVNTLQSVKSTNSIFATSKNLKGDIITKCLVSPRNQDKRNFKNVEFPESGIDRDNYSVFNNTLEVLNSSEKLRKELDFSLLSIEGIENVLNMTSILYNSLYNINQRSKTYGNVDHKVISQSEERIKEYKKVFDECKDHLDKILEMCISVNQNKLSKKENISHNNQPKYKSIFLKNTDFNLKIENDDFLNFINEKSSDLENSQHEKIGEEDNSQDIDLNLKLDYTERIKNLPRSKIQAVRMDKFPLSSQSQSPTNNTYNMKLNFITAKTEMTKNDENNKNIVNRNSKMIFELDKINKVIFKAPQDKELLVDKNCKLI